MSALTVIVSFLWNRHSDSREKRTTSWIWCVSRMTWSTPCEPKIRLKNVKGGGALINVMILSISAFLSQLSYPPSVKHRHMIGVLYFKLFPFFFTCLHFLDSAIEMIRSDMIIKNIGNSLAHILPELIGQDISEVFDLTRPLVDFKFVSVRLASPFVADECLIKCIPLCLCHFFRYWNEPITFSSLSRTERWY